MSHQIPMAFVSKYRADVQLLLQQKQSKFEPYVRIESQNAQYDFYEQIGPVAAQPWGPRHGDTPLMETPHLRRRVGMSPWIWADLIDKPDRLRMLIVPDGPYTTNAVQAFNRRKDDIIIASAFAPAFTGHEGETAVAFPESQWFRNADINANTGSEKITIALLTEIKEKFWNNDVDEEEQLVMAVAPNSISTLLLDEKVTSADYNTVKALVQGDIDTYMGFKFLRTTRLPVRLKVAGDPTKGYLRSNLVWVKSGLLMAKGQDTSVDVDKRPDKKNATQIMVTMDVGGTRMEEKKVVAFETLETAAPVKPAP